MSISKLPSAGGLFVWVFILINALFTQAQTNKGERNNTSFEIACTAPTGLHATSITTSSATLRWTAASGALNYNIQYRPIGNTSWLTTLTTSTSKNITGLQSGTDYEFRVQTDCNNGLGIYSSAVTFSTLNPCSKPVGMSSSQITESSARISWTAITGIMYFNIRYRVTGTSAWTTDSSITNAKVLTGLNANSVYEYQIQTRCSAGLLSSFTTSANFTTLASSCTVPNVNLFTSNNITATTCTIGWNAVSGAVSYTVQYRVRNSGSSWTTSVVGTNSDNISSLSPSTLYEFQVRTNCTSSSSAYSSSGIFTTLSNPCNAPDVNLFSSTGITGNSCTVGWGSISNALSYSVQYRVRNSGNSWTTVSATSNSKTLTGLNASTLYEFQVQTVCAGGSSVYSSPGIFTTTTAVSCGTPSGLNVSNLSTNGATLNWSAVSGATSYSVQYRWTGITAWTTYTASGTSQVLSGLTSNTSYEFQVQSICSGGSSTYSSPLLFTTSSGSSCGTPSGLNVSSLTPTTASLNWNAVSGAVSYTVQYRWTGITTWTTLTTSGTSQSISGLSAANTYEFQVQSTCSAATSSYSTSLAFTTPTTSGASLPVPDHIVICIMENHAYQNVIGNTSAPYINALANDVMSANFTQSYGLVHPSQPNYIMLFSGANQGVTNNVMPTSHFTTMNLARALQNAGRTFTTYSEGLPSVGYDGEASGEYVRRHNPVANWMGTGTNQVSTTTNQPFSAFPTNYANLPTVSFVVPNLTNGMHDGSGNTAIAAGDNWYNTYMAPYVQWARTHNSLFILTFDEDDNLHNNQIPTIFSGQMVVQGQYATSMNHYNLLRTIEDMYGLTHSGAAATSTPIHGCWNNGFRTIMPQSNEDAVSFQIYPNPVKGNASVMIDLEESANVEIKIMSLTGSLIYSDDLGSQPQGKLEINLPLSSVNLRNGMYFLEMNVNGQRFTRRFVKAED
ncbi:MAG TPA: fibronectin type III domain-containing protein [Bacteroidia bacterium]|nr:fibronectin type III domain-containing protein [Bacteroidia bacterium]